ncbi:Dynactin subunit 1 [Papilio machaon]|uniref:Dynactin subunit 1 n=1 Tax=Papilio machaon TaxID=76193 RepID=A0A0N0PFH9_PAPMA|nr:Dynactin subunit 1 [Papilio machaon]
MWSGLGMGSSAAREPVLRACSALDALARALHADATALSHVLQATDKQHELGQLHELIQNSSSALQQQLKSVRRTTPSWCELVERLRTECATTLWRCARAVALAARAAAACAATAGERGEGAPLTAQALSAVWAAATDKMYQQDDHGPVRTIRHALNSVSADVNKLATFTQDNEYDMMSLTNVQQDKPTPPVVLRAQLVKKQLEETKTLTIKLENKEADIKELKKALKAKQEELSEMQIRRELGERKLSAAASAAELRAEQLQRKLDDAHNQLKSTDEPTPPVVLRAQLVKKQLEETKTLTIKLENKEADIKELKKALKAKQEELSEMQIRRELGERKLSAAASAADAKQEELSEMQIRRELGERKLSAAASAAELRAEQLQRKLDDAHNQLKR